jgi:hypothetical protein
MMGAMDVVWSPAHIAGAGGWHVEDVFPAVLVLVIMAGLMLLAAGRRDRRQRQVDIDRRQRGRWVDA